MEYSEVWPGGPRFLNTENAPLLTTDTMLLADFARLGGDGLCGDIGAGSGALILLLAERTKYRFCAFELRPEAARVIHANLELNDLLERTEVVVGDISETHKLFRRGSFDALISNPPYFTPDTKGSADPARDAARRGLGLSEFFEAAAYLLKNGGTISLVYRAERLSELFIAMSVQGIEPKRLRLFAAEPSSSPILCLVEGKTLAKPGMRIDPLLFQRGEDGQETAEFSRINHRRCESGG